MGLLAVLAATTVRPRVCAKGEEVGAGPRAAHVECMRRSRRLVRSVDRPIPLRFLFFFPL